MVIPRLQLRATGGRAWLRGPTHCNYKDTYKNKMFEILENIPKNAYRLLKKPYFL
jgi:hypothetical protein